MAKSRDGKRSLTLNGWEVFVLGPRRALITSLVRGPAKRIPIPKPIMVRWLAKRIPNYRLGSRDGQGSGWQAYLNSKRLGCVRLRPRRALITCLIRGMPTRIREGEKYKSNL